MFMLLSLTVHRSGKTALQIAQDSDFSDVVAMLTQHGERLARAP